MRIREATETDAPRAAALWTEAYTNQGPAEGRSERYAESELAKTAAEATVLVAESEPGEVVGIVAIRSAARARGGEEVELLRLAVATTARGRGVGRTLAERVLELARREGAGRITLWSRPYQVEAHSLYESLGFRRTPERDGRDPDGRRWVFTLDLDRAQ